MTADGEQDADPPDIPRCPIPPLTELVLEDDAPDGSDVRWVCPVEGCGFVRIS